MKIYFLGCIDAAQASIDGVAGLGEDDTKLAVARLLEGPPSFSESCVKRF